MIRRTNVIYELSNGKELKDIEPFTIKYVKTNKHSMFMFGWLDFDKSEKAKVFYDYYIVTQGDIDLGFVIELVKPNYCVTSFIEIIDITEEAEVIPPILYCNNIINNLEIDYFITKNNDTNYHKKLLEVREGLNNLI